MTEIFLKVDIDTLKGFRQGVPRLLDLFKSLNIQASFFCAMGPDHSGRAIRRIFRPGFLKKMRRTNAIGTYGFPTLVYGVLWPGPMISTSAPSILKRVIGEGHELGIHGYDHVLWHDRLDDLEPVAIRDQLDKALEIVRTVLGKDPLGFAAPGWKWNRKTQEIFRDYRFTYTSNSRGTEPYFPVLEGLPYDMLEIPTTLPTLDEVLGDKAHTPDELLSYYLRKLHHHAIHVFTLHAELEGLHYAPWFERLLKIAQEEGAIFRPLSDLARRCLAQRKDVFQCDMIRGQVDGRATDVALQGLSCKLPL